MAALLAGQAVQEASRQFQIDERVIRRWRSAQLSEVVRQKKERISLRLLDYLDETFLTLCEQHKTFRDAKYLKNQTAAELATLHGVIADKGFRLLEAVARLDGETDEDAGA